MPDTGLLYDLATGTPIEDPYSGPNYQEATLAQPISGGGGGGGGGSYVAPAPVDISGDIRDMFGNYRSGLRNIQDRTVGNYGEQETIARQGIGKQYGIQQGNLETQRARGEEKIGRNKANALRDLEGNIRSAFQAGQIRLGNAGAGDSSATGQYSYALTRMSNQNRGDVQRQAGEQSNDLQTGFLQSQGQLDLWKASETSRIGQQYQALKDQLDQRISEMLVESRFNEAQALTDQKLQLAQSAVSSLGNVQSQYDSFNAPQVNTAQAQQIGAAPIGTQSVQSVDLRPYANLPGSMFMPPTRANAVEQNLSAILPYYAQRKGYVR